MRWLLREGPLHAPLPIWKIWLRLMNLVIFLNFDVPPSLDRNQGAAAPTKALGLGRISGPRSMQFGDVIVLIMNLIMVLIVNLIRVLIMILVMVLIQFQELVQKSMVGKHTLSLGNNFRKY